ncbi:caspase family protein [Streptomyces sp. NPDC048106]|uniref:caspase family protein n=1 Tax=Streptomyces sp. NPDC048106 TaxID=3155750 RepID=UPI003456A985
MTDHTAGRRYLLTAAVCAHAFEPDWNREELAEDVHRVAELFTREFGYTHVPLIGVDPTKEQLLGGLREFCVSPERTPEDYVVVYFAGHGEVRENTGEHILITADTRPDDLAFTSLRTEELARALVEETPLRRVLLMLDTCESGSGGAQVAARAVVTDPSWRDAGAERGFVVIASTQPYQLALPGAFTEGLVRAVHSLATVGSLPGSLPIDSVVAMMRGQDGPAAGTQQVVWDAVRLTGTLPAFLPNPRAAATADTVDLMLTRRAEQQALRREEFSRELLPKARASLGGGRWNFCGRHEALRAVTDWLNDDKAKTTAGLVVTGAPGSGKSALLGLVSALAHPDWRRTVPLHDLGLTEDQLPCPGRVNAIIYARGATEAAVLAGIAAAAGSGAQSVGALIEHLHRWPEPVTVAVDALDEAAAPEELVATVLRPLLDYGGGTRFRLLLGTRPDLLPLLARHTTAVDLDAPAFRDPQAVRAHVADGLRAAPEDSPFRHADADTSAAIAEAVAEAAGRSFLVARLITQSLVASPTLPDPADAKWRATLPRLPGDAMRGDLEHRFAGDLDPAYDILAPLAHAGGQGLPWENLWAALASRAGGGHYTDEDVLRFRQRAGSYVIEDTLEGRSVYRLYHQALAEHVREVRPASERTHAAFAEVLRASAPRRPDGGPDWQRAHPYVRHHYAGHAVRGRVLGESLTDPYFLLAADPERLRHALRQEDHGAEAAAYHEYTLLRPGDAPGERLSYLLLAARRAGAARLARAIEAMDGTGGPDLPWRTPWARWRSDQQVQRLLSHPSPPASMAVTGADELVTLDSSGLLRSWDLATESATSLGSAFDPLRSALCGAPDGTVLLATWEGDRVVARDALSGEAVTSPLALSDDPPAEPRPRGPVAALRTADGCYVAAAYHTSERTLGASNRPYATYRVGVRFTSHDGKRTWSATNDVRGVRALADLALVEDRHGRILVVSADTRAIQNRRTRVDVPRLRVWSPQGGIVKYEDPRLLSSAQPLRCMATRCAAARVGEDVVLALGTTDGSVLVWKLFGEKRPLIGEARIGSARGVAHVSAVAFGSLHGEPVVVFGQDSGSVTEMSLAPAPSSAVRPLVTGLRRVTAVTVVGGAQVAVATEEGKVIVYERHTEPASDEERTRTLADGGPGPAVYAADAAGGLHAYHAATGALLASAQPGSPIRSMVPLGASGGVAHHPTPARGPSIWHWERPGPRSGGATGAGVRHHGGPGPDLAALDERTVLTFTEGCYVRTAPVAVWRVADDDPGLLGPADLPEAGGAGILPGFPRNPMIFASAVATVGGAAVIVMAMESMLRSRLHAWRRTAATTVKLGSFPFPGSRPPTVMAVGAFQGTTAVVTADRSGALRLYDILRGKPMPRELPGHEGSLVSAVAFREELGRSVVASASVHGHVILTDLASGRTVTVDLGEPVASLAVCTGLTTVAATASGLTALTF